MDITQTVQIFSTSFLLFDVFKIGLNQGLISFIIDICTIESLQNHQEFIRTQQKLINKFLF
jgi:hypothetical protein